MKGDKLSGINNRRTTTKSGKLHHDTRSSSPQTDAHHDQNTDTRAKQPAVKHRQNVASQRRVSTVNRTFTPSRAAQGSTLSNNALADKLFTPRKQIALFTRSDKSYLFHKTNTASKYNHQMHTGNMSKHMSQVKPAAMTSSYNRQGYLSPGGVSYSRNACSPRIPSISSRSMSAVNSIGTPSRCFSTTNTTNMFPRRGLPAEHSTQAPSKDAPNVNKTETQSVEKGNAFAGLVLNKYSVSNMNESQFKRVSASVFSESRTDTSPRNMSAIPKFDEEHNWYPQVVKVNASPSVIVPVEEKIDGLSRGAWGLHSIGTILGGVANENNRDTPESDILKITHIYTPPRKVTEHEKSESPFRDVSQVERPNYPAADTSRKNGSLCARTDSPSYNEQPTTDRTDISSRASPLMMGSGVMNKTNDVEKLELHLSETDFSSLLTKKRGGTSNMFCVAGSTYPHEHKDNNVSPRSVKAALPKTYITRSGSLFLYSDSNIMKDIHDISSSTSSSTRTFEMHGYTMPTRTLVPHSYPSWGKLVKKSSSAQENRATGNKIYIIYMNTNNLFSSKHFMTMCIAV